MTQSGRGRPLRRRSWRRRQLRRIRLTIAAGFVLVIVITGWLVVPRHHSSSVSAYDEPVPVEKPNFAALAARIKVPQSASIHHYPIYNYSVVRGGVHSVAELRRAVAHDRAVAEHYARFQYEHAQLVRLREPALVYLSYRMNDKIFWTRERHRLTPGEELITDGVIAARTKCANQVSTRKQLAVSPEEPPIAELEQVEPPLLPPAETRFPVLYKESLLTTPTTAQPWVGPRLGPNFPMDPPRIPSGLGHHKPVCESQWQEKQEAKQGIDDDESKEVHCKPHHKPGSPVPEPASLFLTGSGLAAVYGAYRRRKSANTNIGQSPEKADEVPL